MYLEYLEDNPRRMRNRTEMDDGGTGIYRGYFTDLGSHQYIIVRLDTGQSIVSEMRRWTLTTKCGSLSDWNTLLS